jgi:integrase
MASIRKRNGKHTVIYDYYEIDGTRKQKSKAFDDEKEALKFKNEVENDKLHNTLVIPSSVNMRDFLAKWIDIYGKEKWQYQTYSTNKGLINNHILPELGNVQLQNITPLMVERFMARLKNKRVTGSTANNKSESEAPLLSSTTARHIYFILKTAFDKAVEWRMLKESPVKCRAPSKQKSKRRAWDVRLVRAILDDIEHKQLHLAVHLAFICSLRIGEVVGLTWDCVDFNEGKIHINKIVQRASKESLEAIPPTQLIKVFEAKTPDKKSVLILKNPKTEESIREVFITEPLLEEFKQRLNYLERRKQFLGDEFTDHNLVFTQEDGSPIEPKLCEKWFMKWQSRTTLDVSGLVFHEIRHSSTTYKLIVSNGDIKSVQGDTGHASSKMVLDGYAHTMNSNRLEMVRRVERDFYDTPANESKLPNDVDGLIANIKSDPEMMHKFITALLSSANST